MKCLFCDQLIRIETFSQLISLRPILLCNTCDKHLVKQSEDILYKKNDWLASAIERLNRGDLELRKIFVDHLKNLIKKRGIDITEIKVVNYLDSVFPWLEIILSEIDSSFEADNEFYKWIFCINHEELNKEDYNLEHEVKIISII